MAAALACVAALVVQAQDSGLITALRNIPLGVENLGAVLPSFDSSGHRSSVITADVVRRVDDERLYAEGFALEQYAKDPQQNLRIELPTAHYNMTTGTLRSLERGKVTRGNFQIEGDTLVFDSRTNRGLMEGNIRTVIFDTRGKQGE